MHGRIIATVLASLIIGFSFYHSVYGLQEPISVQSLDFVDMMGVTMQTLEVGEQVLVQSFITNNLQDEQKFAYIVQITDSNGSTVSLAWMSSIIPAGKTIDVALSWIPDVKGSYKAQAFVWRSITDPTPLSLKIPETSIIVGSISSLDKPAAQPESSSKTKYSVWDQIDSNIHIMYVSQICSEESRTIQQTKAQQIGDLTLSYIQYYGITKEFTYAWHCLKMDENYSWTYYKQPNELMIFLLPNNVVVEDMERGCGFVEFPSNEIYIYQTCHVKRPIGYTVSHELSHWILYLKYPDKPSVYVDWVHNTQDCWDSGSGCQDYIIVNGIAYTVMPRY